MIKALFIAPYAAMENLIETCAKEEHELDLQIGVGNLQEGVLLAKRAEAEDVEVIISRGGTAKLISEAVDLPVIDVHVSGYDMLRVLTLANDFPRKKAIVGFSAITLGAKAIINLLEIPIDIFTIEAENETEPLLMRLKDEGYQLIMGDVVTVETASRLGLLGILIQSGREAIFDAFKEAKTVSQWMMKSKRKIDQLKSILQVTVPDFLVLSENGEILYEQWQTLSQRPVTEFKVEMGQRKREITHVRTINGNTLKVIQIKIELNGTSMIVCEFSNMEKKTLSEAQLKVKTFTPPLVIDQSEAMKVCLNKINRSLSYNHFILIGEEGTGKGHLAEYIHYNKHLGNGLYASIKAIDVVEMFTEEVDRDIKTIYVQGIEQLEEEWRDVFTSKMEAIKERGITLILPMLRELPFLKNILFKDDTSRIYIPTLTERKEDLKELVTSFILHFHQTLGTSAIKINENGLELLAAYKWPGNVEELKAFIKDAALIEKDYVIEPKLIETLLEQKGIEKGNPYSDLLTGSLEVIEKRIIEKVLEEEDFNQTKAAKRLNINRTTLWRKLKG
jgi:transcriptional regulator, propionate catabolism operon regulatory protein